MDRAVIQSIRLGQGTYNPNLTGYVGWVKLTSGDKTFSYKWQFGA